MRKIQRQFGIWYTLENPFRNPRVENWLSRIINERFSVIEPFAGSGNLPRMLPEVNWQGLFDISPPTGSSGIVVRDCLSNFPKSSDGGQMFRVAITNPPWLSKNSAKKRGLEFDETFDHDDLYKQALLQCLNNCDYVMAILPESFVRSGLFRERLVSVIRLNSAFFGKEVEHPACIALFEKDFSKDFEVWEEQTYLGFYTKLRNHEVTKLREDQILPFIFNSTDGEIFMHGLDTRAGSTISFSMAGSSDKANIKRSSRHNCTIKCPFEVSSDKLTQIVVKSNEILADYREKTFDVDLGSTKSRRNDGRLRRRLDFDSARRILTLAYGER